MSTNWFHDFFFGSNESSIESLEKLQRMDAEQFQKAFNALKELEKGQQINADQIQTAFSRLESLISDQKIDAERFESMQNYLNGLQERLTGVEKKVETLTGAVADHSETLMGHGSELADLTETVANQEKAMLICCIVASTVALAAIGFIGFCIYQGVKSEREKHKSFDTSVDNPDKLSSDTEFHANVSSEKPGNRGLMVVD